MLSGLSGDFDDWPNLRTAGLVPSSGQDPVCTIPDNFFFLFIQLFREILMRTKLIPQLFFLIIILHFLSGCAIFLKII